MRGSLEEALESLRTGKGVILLDAYDRENEADLVYAPQFLTQECIGFMLEHGGGGLFCVPLTKDRITTLGLQPLTSYNSDGHHCNFCTPVDPKDGGSGVNTQDRLLVVDYLTNGYQDMHLEHPHSRLKSPGHTFPLIAHEQGLRGRQGHTEGSLALMQLADLPLSLGYGAVIHELMHRGQPLRGEMLKDFSRTYGIPMVTIEELQTQTSINTSVS